MDAIGKLKAVDEEHRDLYGHILRWEFWFAVVLLFAGWMGAAYLAGPEYGSATLTLVAFGTTIGMIGYSFMQTAIDKAEDGS